MDCHGAVASTALGDEGMVAAVLADRDAAPIAPGLRATLAFLEKMTLRPEELGAADAEAVRAAGVSDAALDDAIAVCAAFNMINRMADALGFRLHDPASYRKMGAGLLKRGYK